QLMAHAGIPSVLFSIADYASPAEIQPLVDFIPKDRHVEPEEVYAKHQPPLEIGSHMHDKLVDFGNETTRVYQKAMTQLSVANQKLPYPTKFRTLSLLDIAGRLVPKMANPGGGYPPTLLYAIHETLLNDEAETFRSLNQISRGKHVSYLYRISPLSSIAAIVKVRSRVRAIMEAFGSNYPFAKPDKSAWQGNNLWWFIVKARGVIKQSRELRAWTDHGIITPHHDRYPKASIEWSDEHKQYIRFIELWASNQFRLYSPLHSMGSAILRLTGMYGQSKMLNMTTGWAFLQETGWIPSWENPVRYRYPLPGAAVLPGGGYDRADPGAYKNSMRPDIAAGHRKDWGPIKAYCIDAPYSTLLDDAVSFESTETPGEHWLHVHTADPAAFIEPHSKLIAVTSVVAMDHYLPGYRYTMFPENFFDEVVMKQMSLDKDRPCLTFSTRLNEAGEILESKVQAGTLREVTFISPDEIDKICPPLRAASVEVSGPHSLSVGPEQIIEPPATRKMHTVDELSAEERAQFKTMHRVLAAVDAIRTERGAVRQVRSTRSVRVMFDRVGDQTPKNCTVEAESWPGDPAIKIELHDQHDGTLVSMAMTLAGESAAKWCHARKIPVPYHVQPGAVRVPEAMRALSQRIRSMTERGEAIPPGVWQLFDSEAGPSALAVEPGPVVIMGLDMYTKVTSPLRRLTDCITHW
ncbi:MAG: RNB domain-containing ribonuclease, partial [Acidobacteria bacterium]|nr:RNB domain-containing ribonuclease [Acidobacteriota bacterium]